MGHRIRIKKSNSRIKRPMIYKRRDRRTRRFFARNVVEPQRADYFRLWDRLKEVKEMTVNITPLHDRVLVRRLEEKETAKGGIIIPDTAKEKPQEGEVMAVGAG